MIAALVLLAAAAPAAPDCASCHAAQAEAWASSLHAASRTDPLYTGMRAWAREEAGDAAAARCATCHTVAIAGGAARTDAVTCEACHQGRAASSGPAGWTVDPDLPVAAARPAEAAPVEPAEAAPEKPAEAAPHAVRVVADIDREVCLACHAELHNPAGVPLCTTGPEAALRASGPTCTTCHVPGGDHAFPGAEPALLRRAARLTLDRRGDQVVATVVNVGAGHALPTGSALRQIRLEVAFRDAAGRALEAAASGPAGVLARILGDAEGNAPVPPWRATRVARDTRLGPGEGRAFPVAIPAGAASAEARLTFHRAPAPILARLSLAPEGRLAPVEMARFVLPLE